MRKDGNINQWYTNEIESDILDDEGEYVKYYVEYDGLNSRDGKFYLSDTLLEHCDYGNNKYLSIIRLDNKPYTLYYDWSKTRKIYVYPDYTDKCPEFEGVSQRDLNKITKFANINNYTVSLAYYDYEEACLLIKEIKSNIDPQALTDYELDYLAKLVAEHMADKTTDTTGSDDNDR